MARWKEGIGRHVIDMGGGAIRPVRSPPWTDKAKKSGASESPKKLAAHHFRKRETLPPLVLRAPHDLILGLRVFRFARCATVTFCPDNLTGISCYGRQFQENGDSTHSKKVESRLCQCRSRNF